jgi:hypothetical protein
MDQNASLQYPVYAETGIEERMSISFACPQCNVQVEVADEFAGHAGQCPRCQSVIAIPSGNQPPPLPAEEIPPPREARRKPKAAPVPEEPRRRRTPPTPAKPFGPIWPWLVGGLAALVFIGLMASSVAVLAFWREPVVIPKREEQPAAAKPVPPQIDIGQLDGKKAVLAGGVFQVRGTFTVADAIDFTDVQLGARGRSREFEIEMRADKDYQFEYVSAEFDAYLSIARQFEFPPLTKAGARGARNIRLIFRPPVNGAYSIRVSSFEPSVGAYTLTIRELERPRPFIPG